MGWFVFGLGMIMAAMWGIVCPALGIPMGWQLGIWFTAYGLGHATFIAIRKSERDRRGMSDAFKARAA